MNPASDSEHKRTIAPTIAPTQTNMSPVDWWSGWSDFFGITAAIVGGILAVITLLGWGFTWKAGKLKDEALEEFKIQSDARISEANANAANANKAAAEARERAAIAEGRLQRRFFTPDQSKWLCREAFRNVSKTDIKIEMESVNDSAEASDFASIIGGVLMIAGFDVSRPKTMPYIPVTGIIIFISDYPSQKAVAAARAIADALSRCGFPPQEEKTQTDASNRSQLANMINIMVCARF